MNKDKRIAIINILKQGNPNPQTELNYNSDYQLLVAVVLSAQATDISVNKCTKDLFAVAPTPEKMVELGIDKIKSYIKTIGLFNSKANSVYNLSLDLINKHNSQVPDDFKSLTALPGVGRKTANVVLNVAFGHPTVAVDTHIFRVGNRTKFAVGKDPDAVEDKIMRSVPTEYRYGLHHWLILHGRYICTARRPKCYECPIFEYCEFKDKELYSNKT